MSIESVAIALHHSRAKGTTKLVLLGIANHDGDGGAFPKVATLAKYANIHPRRITEHLAKLGELGEIIIHQQEGGTRRTLDAIRPNLYEFVLECPADCDRTKHHRIQGEKLGRAYRGQYDPTRTKDPERVERATKARERSLAATREAMDRAREAVENHPAGPGAENSPSAENSTRPSAENSTTPSAENSTTKNHQKNHPLNPGLVVSSPANGAGVENPPAHSGTTAGNDAAPGPQATTPSGLIDQKQSQHSSGAARARAALRGELPKSSSGHDEGQDTRGLARLDWRAP